jgi:hypothetical protein
MFADVVCVCVCVQKGTMVLPSCIQSTLLTHIACVYVCMCVCVQKEVMVCRVAYKILCYVNTYMFVYVCMYVCVCVCSERNYGVPSCIQSTLLTRICLCMFVCMFVCVCVQRNDLWCTESCTSVLRDAIVFVCAHDTNLR